MDPLFERLRKVIDGVRIGRGDEDETLSWLAIELDQITALLWQQEPDLADQDHPEPPDLDPDRFLELVRENLPGLRTYRLPEYLPEERGTLLGDAARDLAALLAAWDSALWCARHNGTDHGIFFLQLGFRAYWGRYLRCLQLYLHDLLY